MRLRLALPGDAEAIRAIYNHEVSNGTNTFDLVPRSLEDQRRWISYHRGAHPAVVAAAARSDGFEAADGTVAEGMVADGTVADGALGPETVVGFGVITPYRDRPAYATTVEDSVYVHRDHRGRGVGRAVLEELVRLAAGHGFHTVIARVSGDNEASIALHRGCGFGVVGTEREVGRKHGRWLDIVELQRML